MESVQNGLRWMLAAIAALWAGLPELTQLLIWLMMADVALGFIVAARAHELSAARAWDGVTKKIVSLLLIGIAGLVNPHVRGFIEINLVQAASAFYIVPELTSIMRNAALLDVPVFVQLKDILRFFQASSGENSSSKAK